MLINEIRSMLTRMHKTLALRTGRSAKAAVLAAVVSFLAFSAAHAGGLAGGVVAGGGSAAVSQGHNQNSGHVHNNGGLAGGVFSHSAKSGDQSRGKNGSAHGDAIKPGGSDF
jgi:hypothetical protein